MKMKKDLNRWIARPLSVVLVLVLLFSVLLVPASAEGEVEDTALDVSVTVEETGELMAETLESEAEAFDPAMETITPVVVVSLGDSYSSGEGIEPFYGQDKANGDKVRDANWVAHRSTRSWPARLVVPAGGNVTSEQMGVYFEDVYNQDHTSGSPFYKWYFVAASGAVTADFNGSQHKSVNRYGYILDAYLYPQLKIFDYITETVDFVTMTIGGNDVGFADIVKECALGSTYLGTSSLKKKLDSTFEYFYGSVKFSIKQAYRDVEAKAPNAELIVAGYPKLLDQGGKGAAISQEEADLVNAAVTQFNGELKAIVNECRQEGMKIHFVDVEPSFNGHEAYSSDPWVNPIWLGYKDQDISIGVASSYSVHPNDTGAGVYARCVNAKIAELARAHAKTGVLSGKVCKASDRTTPVTNATISVTFGGKLTNYMPDGNGNYSIELPPGEYCVQIRAPGYIDFNAYATITVGENTYMETFLLVQGTPGETGIAAGRVSNAQTGVGIRDVELRVRSGWNNTTVGDVVDTTTTDDDGCYSLSLPLGNYTVEAVLDGYVTSSFNIIVQSGTTDNQNGTMMPVLTGDSFRIVLTWGEDPRDLDSHVVGSLSDGVPFHVYYGNKNAYDGDVWVCNLDVDDTTSYGPETTTLNTTSASPYYYYIYKYSGNGTVGSSGAQIKVYQGERLIATFNVPTDQGSGDYWNVFAIVNGRIVIRNTITDYAEVSYADLRMSASLAGIASSGLMVKDTDGEQTEGDEETPDEPVKEETPTDDTSGEMPPDVFPPKEDADPDPTGDSTAPDDTEPDTADPAEPTAPDEGEPEAGDPAEPADDPAAPDNGGSEGNEPAGPTEELTAPEDTEPRADVPVEPTQEAGAQEEPVEP